MFKRAEIEGGWEFIDKTPAGGMTYYDLNLDQVAVVYDDIIKVFNRKRRLPIEHSNGKYPCAYDVDGQDFLL